jgi:sulfate permease, SulP family
LKYRENGKAVDIVGLNKDSSQLVQKLAVHNKENASLSNH